MRTCGSPVVAFNAVLVGDAAEAAIGSSIIITTAIAVTVIIFLNIKPPRFENLRCKNVERNLNKRKHRAFALEKTSNFGVTSFPAKTTANEASFAEAGICSFLIQSAVYLPRIWCVRRGWAGRSNFYRTDSAKTFGRCVTFLNSKDKAREM